MQIGVRREVLELVAPEHQDSTLNCDKLYYLATSRLGRVDIYFTLCEWEKSGLCVEPCAHFKH